jgi:hypothetical protein
VKAFVLGTPDDVRGFGLAGIPGRPCTTADQFRAAAASIDPDVGLLLLSSGIRALSPEAFDELRERSELHLVVLP